MKLDTQSYHRDSGDATQISPEPQLFNQPLQQHFAVRGASFQSHLLQTDDIYGKTTMKISPESVPFVVVIHNCGQYLCTSQFAKHKNSNITVNTVIK